MIKVATDYRRHQAIAKLLISIFSITSERYLKKPFSASSADTTLLMMAVHVGYMEGRPMTPAKIAAYIGMPRPTAVRKLKELAVLGLVAMIPESGLVTLPDDLWVDPDCVKAVNQISELIKQSAHRLTKLDT